MSFPILFLVLLSQLLPTCLAIPAPQTVVLAPTPSADAEFALTTTFVPPESCTSQRLTQLASPLYEIWMNEPRPALSITVGDCYPSQFMKNYTSISFASQVPAMSPLVCPQHWSTVLSTGGYAACCPENYSLHNPSSINSIRPAFGGTCYSPFTIGQIVPVTAYDSLSATATLPWTASTAGAQAYAHIIDGYVDGALVPSIPSSTSANVLATVAVGGDPNSPTHDPEALALPPSALAGITIGASAALIALISLGILAYRSRRHNSSSSRLVELPAEYKLQEMSAEKVVYRYELGDGVLEKGEVTEVGVAQVAQGAQGAHLHVTEEDMGMRSGRVVVAPGAGVSGMGMVSPGVVSPMGEGEGRMGRF